VADFLSLGPESRPGIPKAFVISYGLKNVFLSLGPVSRPGIPKAFVISYGLKNVFLSLGPESRPGIPKAFVISYGLKHVQNTLHESPKDEVRVVHDSDFKSCMYIRSRGIHP
jgi:hypothetical protein